MLKRGLVLIIGVAIVLAAPSVNAGVEFRLEIGPPIAGGPTASKEAVLVVRPLCCDVATVRITATAEGFVDGRRRSIPLQVTELSAPGVRAISREWPDGQWVVHLNGTCAERNTSASILVPVVGARFVREKIQSFARVATQADIDSALQGRDSVAGARVQLTQPLREGLGIYD